MGFQAAQCPNCGGELQVPTDRANVHCMYCGGAVVVQEAVTAAASGNVKTWMQVARTAAAAGNHAEAINFYNKVLEVDPQNYEAWVEKGASAGWCSTLAHSRIPEMVMLTLNGFQCAPEAAKSGLGVKAGSLINDVAIGYYNLSTNHLTEFITVPKTWPEHLVRCGQVLDALEKAHNYSPHNQVILQNIITISGNNIQGVPFYDRDRYGNPVGAVARVSSEYEQALIAKRSFYAAKLRALNSNYQLPTVQKAARPGLCFIATAAMGSKDDPRVKVLQRFRDERLLQCGWGTQVMKMYMRHGPRAARIIQHNDVLRWLARKCIVMPASWLADRFFEAQAGGNTQ